MGQYFGLNNNLVKNNLAPTMSKFDIGPKLFILMFVEIKVGFPIKQNSI